jgi:hypothetical protein
MPCEWVNSSWANTHTATGLDTSLSRPDNDAYRPCLYLTLSYKLTQMVGSNTLHMYSEGPGTNLQQDTQVLWMATTKYYEWQLHLKSGFTSSQILSSSLFIYIVITHQTKCITSINYTIQTLYFLQDVQMLWYRIPLTDLRQALLNFIHILPDTCC